jgi:hypothetical protein
MGFPRAPAPCQWPVNLLDQTGGTVAVGTIAVGTIAVGTVRVLNRHQGLSGKPD